MSKQAAPRDNNLPAASVAGGVPETSRDEQWREDAVPSDEGAMHNDTRPMPACEPDDGPLTDAQIERIKKMVPQGNYRPTRSLFLDLENEIWPPDAD